MSFGRVKKHAMMNLSKAFWDLNPGVKMGKKSSLCQVDMPTYFSETTPRHFWS